MANNRLLLFSGSSNPELAGFIARKLQITPANSILEQFADGEIRFQSLENVRGADVYVVQSFTSRINFHIMESLIIADALKRASASRITAVITYYAYARQDRKDRPRVPISARLVADLLQTAGYSRVLTADLHSAQIQGFFNIPVDNLMALPVFISHFKQMKLDNLVIVAPDAGGVERARLFASKLNADLAMANKRRDEPNKSKLVNIIGDVENKDVIIVDDIIDTAGTLCQTASAIKERGAKKIFACATHGLFSRDAFSKIKESAIERIFVTDTIPLQKESADVADRITTLSVSEIFAQAIESIHYETSVSKLFL